MHAKWFVHYLFLCIINIKRTCVCLGGWVWKKRNGLKSGEDLNK